MIKVFATEVVISKGFDGAAALRFSDNGDNVRFRFGKRVYDTRAENNTRWLNCSAKAFGALCERIKKMQLKEGSYVNLIGRLDEDVWTDQEKNEKKSAMVIILDEIEYCSSGSGKQSKDANNTASQTQANAAATAAPAQTAETPSNFTGFEPFGGGNSFFDET